MKAHRKVISMPIICPKANFVNIRRGPEKIEEDLRKSSEKEQKCDIKEKVLFRLINKNPTHEREKVFKESDPIEDKDKLRIRRFISVCSKLGDVYSESRKDSVRKSAVGPLPELKDPTPQPYFVRRYKSNPKPHTKNHFSNPALIIKKTRLFPVFTSRN